MVLTWQMVASLLGRLLISSYFFKAGINNARNWSRVLGLLKVKKIPLPGLALLAVIIVELLAPLALVLNFYALSAAVSLIIFTLFANFLICNYWTMEGINRRNVGFVFYANIAVIGGLFLIMALSQ